MGAHSRRLKGRKAVAGSLPPWFLKAASSQLAHDLAAQVNTQMLPPAWLVAGLLPFCCLTGCWVVACCFLTGCWDALPGAAAAGVLGAWGRWR